MGIFLLIILSQLSVDIARFKAENNLTLCEIYVSIPYSELSYEEEKGVLKSNFKIKMRVNSLGQNEIYKEWDRISYINSYEQAELRNLHALDELDLFLREGEYNVELEIEGKNKKIIQKSVKIEPQDTTLYLSDIELATNIEQVEGNGKFVKNGLQVIPNPQATFGARYPILYAYNEIYNLKKESKYEIKYSILNEFGDIVKELPSDSIFPTSVDIAKTGGINIIAFEEGTYILKIEVSQGDKIVSKEKTFFVVESLKKEENEFKLTDEELKYYDLIQYIAKPEELAFYNSLPEDAKMEFLINFWKRVERPFFHTFIERVKYADNHFSSAGEIGRNSDMGKIWIKYGKPDEVEQYPADPIYRPCEKWIYFGKGGIVFIFVDKLSCGRYELIYSSIKEELTDPNYRKWVNPELLE
ncbi:MAG: GWxTD domain-containing protein [bacterium]|nr:GWxTD domain-containing protein [bacterium]